MDYVWNNLDSEFFFKLFQFFSIVIQSVTLIHLASSKVTMRIESCGFYLCYKIGI